MHIVLFDTPHARKSLYPFTSVRPVADIRNGIFTIRERWERMLSTNLYTLSEEYLQSGQEETLDDFLYIDAAVLPNEALLFEVKSLHTGEGLTMNSRIIALRTTIQLAYGFVKENCKEVAFHECSYAVDFLEYPFQLNHFAAAQMEFDFRLITKGRKSAIISSSNQVINPGFVFIEEGATVEFCTINATGGFVYIGNDTLVMEGAMIRGSFALLENSVVKMGAKIYGTTIAGKNCTIGGEIKNTVFFNNSNKAHDGYLGDAVIGEWCNFGAGTSASNVKNTAGEIKLWNPLLHQWLNAGTKCGVMMGDYSRTAINTVLNTGTVTGLCCNIVGEGFPPKYIPHFTWNTLTKEKYVLEKAFTAIDNWKKMKQQSITETEKEILQYIYNSQP
jgi:UDP-N-acetylglucosamine diphosphorylase / glucose-1-phosphate thymidylyltransferase / UDP-N-acetylgalactosamine diphosphorylase / glucosamine-1-phosphate N-acetyltransferase / galactosamine-1-phosphate N-acetyltransferase